MPDESCRNCGDLLHDLRKCAECNKIVSMICKNCGKKTDEQLHVRCLYYKRNSRSNSVRKQSENYSIIAIA